MATQSVSSIASANSTGIDAGLLRHAIRLVHCLQKERGSSCAYYADNVKFEASMLEARSASDISASLIQHKDLPVKSSLVKIRKLIATHKNPQDSDDSMALHRIFVCFNTLISSVLHECVLNQVHAGMDQKLWGSTIRNHHRRGLSIDINERLSSDMMMKTFPQAVSGHPVNPKRLETLDSVDTVSSSEAGKPPLIPSRDTAEPTTPPRRKVTIAAAAPSPKVRQLLDLLHIFVQLKESAGTERAILSSVLALRGTDDNSMEFLVNDLILELENQRNLLAQLENLPEDQHRNLVMELGTLSPRLEELQAIILTDYESLRHAEFDAETIWDLITQYVDKLHSVELLLVEELECCLPVSMKRAISSGALSSLIIAPPSPGRVDDPSMSSTDEDHAAWNQALQRVFVPVAGESLVSKIKSMTGDEVKDRLLDFLGQGGGLNSHQENYADSIGAGSTQHEAATHLKEEMNRALSSPTKTPKSKEWEISIYELKFTKRIGVGGAATTYLADWSGQQVAVKVASATRFGLEGWRTEVDALQRLHHPNIIRLMGSVYHENPLTYCLVLEYCNAGDLATVLKYPTPKNFFFNVSMSIANAMSYLHTRRVIHRDLKPANVLCDGNIASGKFTVKVTDFGVSTDFNETSMNGSLGKNGSMGKLTVEKRKNLTGETGTYRWMAPEVIRHESYSMKADVYSFAIMLWQFVTHEEPYMDVGATDAARIAALEKQRPPIPDDTPATVKELITTNWDDKPCNRLAFEKISEKLHRIKDTVTAAEREFLEEGYGHPVYEYDEPNVDEVKKKPSTTDKGRRHSRPGGSKEPGENNRRSSLLSSFFGNKKSDKKKGLVPRR